MTLPSERYAALLRTDRFLRELARHGTRTPSIRETARMCLKHYPWEMHLKQLAEARPGILEATD